MDGICDVLFPDFASIRRVALFDIASMECRRSSTSKLDFAHHCYKYVEHDFPYVLVVDIDVISGLLVVVETDAYNPRMPDIIRTVTAIGIVLLLWFLEALLSSISVVLLVRRRQELTNV